jgi:hypothetical protein
MSNADDEGAPEGSGSKMDGVSMLPETTNAFTPRTLHWYEGILSQFPGEHRRKSKTDADVICPVHDDHNPSLGVDLRHNGAAGPRACYELGQKSHRNADFTVDLVPSRSLFPAFLSRF